MAPVTPLIVYFFLAIVNGHGMTGGGFSTSTECEESRAEMAQSPDVMFISESCQPMTLKPSTPAPAEKGTG